MSPAARKTLEKLHRSSRSLSVGGRGGVNPRTARWLIEHGYVFSWAAGEFDPWGPFVYICAKRNHNEEGKADGFVRTSCSCNAGVFLMKCEICKEEAVRITLDQ